MARYIDVDDFLDLFYVASAGQDKNFIKVVEAVLEDTPTADVEEVRHGYWKIEDDISNKHTQMLVCSVCGRKVFNVENPSKAIEYRPYCHCGSCMDGAPKERGGEK